MLVTWGLHLPENQHLQVSLMIFIPPESKPFRPRAFNLYSPTDVTAIFISSSGLPSSCLALLLSLPLPLIYSCNFPFMYVSMGITQNNEISHKQNWSHGLLDQPHKLQRTYACKQKLCLLLLSPVYRIAILVISQIPSPFNTVTRSETFHCYIQASEDLCILFL